MPRTAAGLTFRQEFFCHAYLRLANAQWAAVEAGYEPASARNQGYRLLRTPRIRDRLAEIQVEAARESCASLDVLLGKLQNVYDRAIEDHHYYAAARAVELQARLTGLRRPPPALSSAVEFPVEALAPAEDDGRRRMTTDDDG